MREVMDAITQEGIHKIAVKSSSQVGKSAVLLNIVGRFAHLEPANILLVQPTLEDAMDFSKVRLQKMIADTKILTPLFYDKLKTRDANQTILSKMFKGGRIILKGANSPSGLAGRPIRILLCDEVDRYPLSADKEGDPVALAIVRCSTYWNYKVALFSTPTLKGQSRIDAAYEEGTQEEWRHACPNCGSFELLDYRQMICDYDERKDTAGNKSVVVRSVKWRCPQCGFEFDEQTMRRAAQMYVVQNPAALANGVRSFFINGFSSPWLSWQLIMQEWLEAAGNPLREAVVMNTRFGLSYEQTGEIEEPEKYVERLENYGGEIPDGVLLLTAGVDVQKNRLECGIYGWNADTCWAICHEVIMGEPTNPSTWAALTTLLSRTFAGGSAQKVARTFIDSGYATAAVYAHCREQMRLGHFAIKGKSIFGAPFLHKTNYLPEAGIYLTTLNVDEGKAEAYARLSSGQVHFGDDTHLKRNFTEFYFKGLMSERLERKYTAGLMRQVWKPISNHIRNEPLDTFVYALAAMKSCESSDANFWTNQALNLRGEVKVKPSLKARLKTRSMDLWTT